MTVEQTGSDRLPSADAAAVWAACRRALRGQWALVCATALCFAVVAVAGLALPTGLGGIVDLVAAGEGTANAVWRIGATMALAALIQALVGGLGYYGSALVVERLLARLREDLVAASLRLPRAVVERIGTGDLVSRASEDVAQVASGLPRSVPTLCWAVFNLAVTAVALLVLNPWFALVALAVAPVHVLAVRWYLRTAPAIYAGERAALGVRAHHVLAALRALPTVQAFGLGAWQAMRIGVASWEVVRWAMRARAMQNAFFARLNFAEFLGMATILVVSFVLVSSDRITVGSATTAMLLFLQLFGPMGALLFLIDELQAAMAAFARIVGVTAAEHAGEDTRLEADSGTVLELREVEFGYDEVEILHGVSFALQDGQRVALVGSSGAGKSTLAGLAAGVHEPWGGAVSVDAGARAGTVLITQEVHVFGGTVRENLTLAKPDASDADLSRALAAVGGQALATDLAHGLDTEVGPEGHQLTTAQAQLVALARVALSDAELVLLDEATAEAGSAHGTQLDAAARAVLEGRSGLVIAHRLDQAVDADVILVMDGGRIVERGSHDELVSAEGTYAELWRAWQRHRR